MLKQKRVANTQFITEQYVKRSIDPRLSNYPFTLNFYESPPPFELSLDEFEIFSLDRLRVLKAIETAKLRSKREEDVFKYMDSTVSEYLDLTRNTALSKTTGQTLYQQRKKDHISHFLLRLAFCRSDELKNWFVRLECTLFKYRYFKEEPNDRERFLKSVQLDAVAVTFENIWSDHYLESEFKDENTRQLKRTRLLTDIVATYSIDPEYAKTAIFYKVPFEQVLELVSRRSVILRGGFAYVPESERVLLVMNSFRAGLLKGLEETARALPRLEEDDRLTPILQSIGKQHVGKEYNSNSNSESISYSDVDSLVTHFPPCMRSLHYTLKSEAHLKHFGRLQYGLFLKGIGLPVEEALIFWRKAFHNKSDDEFQKQYSYNVRYNYGMEGSRKNYAPYSCIKIITSNAPASGDHHGCPFKHYSTEVLRDTLLNYGAPENGVNEMTRLAKEGHYQIACTRFFEMSRPKLGESFDGNSEQGLTMDVIEHPNAWFDLSSKGLVSSKLKSDSEADMMKVD